LNVLECDVEEGARAVGPIVGEMKKCYVGSRKRGIFYVGKKREGYLDLSHLA